MRRVKKRREFLRLQEEGKKISSEHFLVVCSRAKIQPDDSRDKDESPQRESRLGVTITKKIHKSAVQRNRLKRRIREIFRHLRADFLTEGDMVVIARVGATELNFTEIREELLWAFRKLKIVG